MASPQSSEPGDPGQQVADLLASQRLVAKAADNEEYKRFLDHLPIAIAISKRHGDASLVSYANTAFQTLTGHAPADLEGRTWSLLDDFRGDAAPHRPLGEAVAEGEDFLGVFRREREGAEPIAVQAYVGRIETDEGLENYCLVALVDVTEHEQTQRGALKQQIRDKDLLLKELQHRVKNNLQLIIGLIRLEARGARRGDPVDLDRLAGRIESLNLLYDAISATQPGGDQIDLGYYVSQIASALVHTHAGEHILLNLKVEACPASVNVAMPAGLAVNELLTNAIKYAFAGRAKGTVKLECVLDGDDRCCLVVADDGIGLPANTTWPVPGKLGDLITQTLRENAGLELKVESAPGHGTRIEMRFLHRGETPKVN